MARSKQSSSNHAKDDRSASEKRVDWLLDRQIDLPLYALVAIFVAHALSGTSSLSLPQLSTHLPYSIQTLLPGWAKNLPILAPFATELPNASHDSKHGNQFWSATGYAGPFRSDAVGFGHPLSALHNVTKACLGLSYEVRQVSSAFTDSFHKSGLPYSPSYFDRYPWNSWLSHETHTTTHIFSRQYEKGAKDAFAILTGILVFTVLRALTIRYILNPLGSFAIPSPTSASRSLSRAKEARAHRLRRRTIQRFAEQAWVSLWGTLSFALSLFVASQEPYWNNESALWTSWPYTRVSGLTKVS